MIMASTSCYLSCTDTFWVQSIISLIKNMSLYTSESLIINYHCYETEKRMTRLLLFATDMRCHTLKVILWKLLISNSNDYLHDIYVKYMSQNT